MRSSVFSSIEIGRRGCYICDEIFHLAKDYSRCMFRATLISSVRGRGSNKGTRGRDGRTRGGSCKDTQPVGNRG